MDDKAPTAASTSAAASDEKADNSAKSPSPATVANNQYPRGDLEVSNEPEQSPRKLKGIKWIVCVLSIFSSVFLYALDNTIVATIQPAIISDLGHLEKLPWVSVAYQVTSVALDLTWYSLPNILGGADLLTFVQGKAVRQIQRQNTISCLDLHI
jgi:hypothetical protein